jgi:hypothetical protein
MNPHRLCLVSRIPGVAGPAGFQRRLADGLARRGIGVTDGLDDEPYGAVLVIGGTRQLSGLWRARRRGVAVLQRLNGMNWIHRRRRTGLRHFARAEANNLVLQFIRRRVATHVVYQSEFARAWWDREHLPTPAPTSVVLNGVPLDVHAGGPEAAADRIRLLVVEASLGRLRHRSDLGARTRGQLRTFRRRSNGRCRRARNAGPSGRCICAGHHLAGRRAAGLDRRSIARTPAVRLGRHARVPQLGRRALACGLPVVSFDAARCPSWSPATPGASCLRRRCVELDRRTSSRLRQRRPK